MSTSWQFERNGGINLIQQLRNLGATLVFLARGNNSYPHCIDVRCDHQDDLKPIVCRQVSGPPTWLKPMANHPVSI